MSHHSVEVSHQHTKSTTGNRPPALALALALVETICTSQTPNGCLSSATQAPHDTPATASHLLLLQRTSQPCMLLQATCCYCRGPHSHTCCYGHYHAQPLKAWQTRGAGSPPPPAWQVGPSPHTHTHAHTAPAHLHILPVFDVLENVDKSGTMEADLPGQGVECNEGLGCEGSRV